jgi:histidyl-tRNA synthetase
MLNGNGSSLSRSTILTMPLETVRALHDRRSTGRDQLERKLMATPDVNPPRGMRDFLPGIKERREAVLAAIRKEFSRYGYQEIETPVMEDLARLSSSDSGENERLIFRILKRNISDVPHSSGLADLGLRFDLTVPLARFYATNQSKLSEVFRSIQIGPVWRAERPQKGRFRQFTQCDMDVIGEPSILAEIELIAATLKTLASLGIDDARVRLNDRRLLHALLATCAFAASDYARVLIIVDKLDKIGLGGVRSELDAGAFASDSANALIAALERPADLLNGGAYADLITIAEAVEGIVGPGSVRLDPTLVRGMGYYTGPIFEIEHPASGSSIAGGGRYDGMIGRFLNADVPACGFSIGFERIVDLVRLNVSTSESKLALLYDSDVEPRQLVLLQHAFTAEGFSVRLTPSAKRLSGLLDSLKTEGFTKFALVNVSTKSRSDVEIREMR